MKPPPSWGYTTHVTLLKREAAAPMGRFRHTPPHPPPRQTDKLITTTTQILRGVDDHYLTTRVSVISSAYIKWDATTVFNAPIGVELHEKVNSVHGRCVGLRPTMLYLRYKYIKIKNSGVKI